MNKEKKWIFRSLYLKLVLVMVLLIVSVMAIVGTFLLNSISNFYVDTFREEMAAVFDTETIAKMEKLAVGDQAPETLKGVLAAYSTSLGIDSYRNFYILDGSTGAYLAGSNDALDKNLNQTPNMIAAMAGKVGNKGSVMDDYMDVAIPIQGDQDYIIYIQDNKKELQDINENLFGIVVKTMFFALLAAVLLSFLLSKAITTPVENLRKSAKLVAAGDFEHPAEKQSEDEIGELTDTFNDMAQTLKHTIEQAERERDKLNTLFQHMTDGVIAFSQKGGVVHYNLAAERLLNMTLQENMDISQVFGSLPLPDQLDKNGYIETEIQRQDLSLVVLFARYGSATDRGVMAVIRDVTEQKKLEDARREFVANVSHELRTPLTNVKSYTETIIDADGDLPPEMTVRFLHVIANETDRMTRIVKDLLTLTRLDYGKMEMQYESFSMKSLADDVYQAMVMEAAHHQHTFERQMPENDDLMMVGDQQRLQQVLVNIVSNSFKYTPQGGKIQLRAWREENRIYIQVQDNGIGIPEKDIPRLFERFYRVDKARSRQAGGTGLGLAIAKEIIEVHHGTITVESQLDVGTTMTICLPSNLTLHGEQTK